MLKMTWPLAKGRRPGPTFSRVVIIGGGFTGATLARLLAIWGPYRPHDVTVFEPRTTLGAGLAYDTEDEALRLNVAAHRMRAVPGDPQAFLRWLKESGRLERDPHATIDGTVYARRRDFGVFMQAQLDCHIESGAIHHVVERASEIRRCQGFWQVTGDKGTIIHGDIVIIATTHPTPQMPAAFGPALASSGRFIADPSRHDWLKRVGVRDSVLVVGAGLTALDVLASLRGQGHAGNVSLLSRSNLLPRPQANGDFPPYGDILIGQPRTARSLVHGVREAVRDVTASGLPWQSVFDALRHQSQELWRKLPLPEQKRLLRHVRRRFEVHRYRMPPQIAELMKRELAAGRLRTIAGTVRRASTSAHGVEVEYLATGSGGRTCLEARCLRAEWLVLATGPAHGNIIASQRYLTELHENGFVMPDRHRLGLACDAASRAIGADGYPVESLFVAGPLARGTFGELTGVPEIAAQAEHIVRTILAQDAASTRTILIRSQQV